jgi:outer membrane protein assembly factor BamB
MPNGLESPRRSPAALAAGGLVGLMAALVLAVLVRLATTQRHATETTVSVGAHCAPLLPVWSVLIPVGGLALFGLARRRTGAAGWANLGFAASVVVLGAVSLLVLGEQAIAQVPYLSYLLGKPHLAPLLGWRAVALFSAACASALIGGLRRGPEGRLARFIGAPGFVRGGAYALACLYFVYAGYVPKSPRLERAVVSVDRATGALRWISAGLIAPGRIMHSENSPATPTPVTDRERIYAYFGTPGLLAVDVHGRRLWVNGQLPFETREGVASSPVLCQGKVIVLSESDRGGYLAAVDGRTGRLVWRTVRHQKRHSYAGNCRTPCLLTIGGQEVIVVWGYEDVSGYDPVTGRELWSHTVGDLGPGGNPVASAVSDGRSLFLVGPSETVCLDSNRLAGTDPPIRWREYADDGAQCSSPVVQNGLLFAISDNGTAYCLDAETGKTLWTQELQEQHYASVTAIGDRIYFCSTRGRTTVVACDRTYRLLARSDLDEPVLASPAPVDGDLFIRTRRHLYCLRER